MTVHRTSGSLALAGALALALGGCSTSTDGIFTKENAGTVVGGVLGAVVGSQFGGGTGRIVAGVAGGVIGALIGREVGRSMSRADREAANRAQERAHAAPVGQAVTWSNPETGHSGSVTPVSETRNAQGQRCRDYSGTVLVDGKREEARGLACQQSDGTWRFVGS
jgi:surface antigen